MSLPIQELGQVGALIENTHVVYTSGRHGDSYFNKDAIYPHTHLISRLCKMLAEHFADQKIEVVVAPVLGGIILSQWVAHHLSEITHREVLAVYAEKSELPAGFVLKRGYDQQVKGRRALLVEDVLTTGGSIQKVIAVAKRAGAEIIGTAALCNRGGVTGDTIGSPVLFSLFNLSLQSWEAAACPLCAKGIALNTQVGKGSSQKSSLVE